MLSINQIFRLEWEFLKSAGRLFVSDICFFLDAGGFSLWLMSCLCGDGRYAFWSADATDNWFDDEWICFDWSVVMEGCEIWFSVWDWQDTALVCYLMNCIMSIPNVFAETILHLRHLKNGAALLALMHLFILVISFLFILEHCGWTLCPHLLQLIQSILFCFRLLVFLIITDSVSGWFLLHMWHTQLQYSELHVLYCPVAIIRVN